MSTLADRTNPFPGRIALSLSGGGGRAVGFHLGTLAYLDRVGLLSQVSVLSTVSGGTLVGSAWALAQKRGEPFADFYPRFHAYVASNALLDATLAQLAARPGPPSGRCSLAIAYAGAYDHTYFHGLRFGVLAEGPATPLSDVIFNATEFKTGRAWRFQLRDGRCQAGNGQIRLDGEQAKLVRMADLMAASSCIPGGFEPLFFPGDFVWPERGGDGGAGVAAEVGRQIAQGGGDSSIALMDGGVYDNQGIEAVLLAAGPAANRAAEDAADEAATDPGAAAETPHRRLLRLLFAPLAAVPGPVAHDRRPHADPAAGAAGAQTDLGLFIISDTPVRQDPIYGPRPVPPPGDLTLRGLGWVVLVGAATAACSFLAVLWHFISESLIETSPRRLLELSSLDDLLAFGVPLVLTALVAWGLYRSRAEVRHLLSLIPRTAPARPGQPAPKPADQIRRLTCRHLRDMVALRLSSTFAMTNDIFMNRIRTLNYALVERSPLRPRLIANEIDTLLGAATDTDVPVWLRASPRLRDEVVVPAARLGTKIWWDATPPGQRSDLDRLLACGSATICRNLLAHLWRHGARVAGGSVTTVPEHGPREPFADPAQEVLFAAAERDWALLGRDPYALVDARQPPPE